MPARKVRKPAFDFTGDVPFQWQPDNPRLAVSINAASFFAVGFERYVVKVMRDAMPLISDSKLLEEARLFLEQEAQHGIAHKGHIDSMIRIYPGLKKTYENSCENFDEFYDNKSLEYRLAYIANMESAFQPIIKFTVNNRDILFSKGDKQISSLFLWHAIEEIEHRDSACAVYDHLVNNRWYRLAKLPGAIRHQRQFYGLLKKEFESVIPVGDRTAGLTAPPEPFACIPFRQRLTLAFDLTRNFMPWHNPATDKPPEWFDVWMQADRDGVDMTRFYGR